MSIPLVLGGGVEPHGGSAAHAQEAHGHHQVRFTV
jgi:hypothetical protein